MARYINADLFKKNIKPVWYQPDDNSEYDGLYDNKDIEDMIDAQPTAGVIEVKHGHWVRWYVVVEHDIGKEYIPHCKCSECEEEFEPHATRFMKFCSNCGAKMDEETE